MSDLRAKELLAEKQRAAVASFAFNFGSVVLKVVAALITGSVSLLSEAVHSAADVFSSGMAWLGIRAASAPPDDEHPFGHGKIESLTGFGEALVLLGIVGYIAVEAARRLLYGATVEQIDFGIGVMALSSVGSFLVSRYVGAVGTRTGSLALQSNSQHLMVDSVTSVGVLIALGVTRLSGWQYADPLFALIFSTYLAIGAIRMVKKAFHELIDVRLPEVEVSAIKDILGAEPELLGFHRLRSRSSGGFRHIDVHIVVPNEWSLVEAHALADSLEKRISTSLAPANVVIHVDPYDAHRDAQESNPT